MIRDIHLITLILVLTCLASCTTQSLNGYKSEQVLEQKRVQASLLRNEALLCYEAYDYDCAISHYKSIIDILEGSVSPAHLEIAIIANELAEVYRASGQYNDAEALYLHALDIHGSIPDKHPEEHAKVLNNLGLLYKTLGRYWDSIELYKQLHATLEGLSPRDDLFMAITLGNLASLHLELGHYKEAKSLFQQALELREKALGLDHPDLTTALNNLISIHLRLGEYDEAKSLYQRALSLRDIANPSEQPLRTTTLLNSLAALNANLGNYAEAEEQFLRVLDIRRNHLKSQHPDIADSLDNLAWVYQMRGNYTSSEAHYQEALDIRKQVFGPKHIKVAYSLRSLAGLYLLTGEFGLAEPLYQKALIITEESVGPDHPDMAITLNDLALLYRILGDFERAERLFLQALNTIELALGPNHPDMALILNNLALLFYYQEDYARAETYVRRAIAIQERSFSPDHPDIAINLVALGRILREQGAYDASQELFERAHISQKIAKGENHASVAFILSSLAKLHKLRGDSLSSTQQSNSEYVLAKQLYHRALTVAISGGQPEVLWRVQHNLSQLLAEQKNPNAAIFYGIEAVTTLQGLRIATSSLDKKLQQSFLQERYHVYRHLADLLISQGRIPAAQQVLGMLKEAEYFDFVRRSPDEPLENAPSRLRSGKIFDEYDNFRNDLVKLGLDNAKLGQGPRPDPTEAGRIIELEQALDVAADRFTAYLLELESRLLQSGYKRSYLPFLQLQDEENQLQVVLSDLEYDLMQPGWVLIHTLITDDKLHLIMTTQTTQHVRFSEVKAEDLHRTITDFRSALQSANDLITINQLAKRLYDWVFAPLALDLRQANTKVVAISLDGALRYVPIAALFDGNKYIAEDYAIVMYTETAKLHFSKLPAKSWQVAGLGASKAPADTRLPDLPAVKDELNGIVKDIEAEGDEGVLPGILYFDQEFTEDTLKFSLGNRDYPVLHVAGHFSLNTSNMRNCRLLLGDGKSLSLEKIKQGWGQRFQFRKDLVTLSACNTAVSSSTFDSGIEVESFGALAQRSGAKSVLATLWPVSDSSTGLFMQLFYDLREKHGLTKAEALRQAQLALLRSNWLDSSEAVRRGVVIDYGTEEIERYRHPYFWAPFVLMGNGL